MTYVVTGNCKNCEVRECLALCPVDCFHEGDSMLVIHPDDCVDCGVCEIDCPSGAILSDGTPEAGPWIEVNRRLAARWPRLSFFGPPGNETTEGAALSG